MLKHHHSFRSKSTLVPHLPHACSSGHQLCREAWLRFLGVGKARLTRTKRKFRGLDERSINQGILVSGILYIFVYPLNTLTSDMYKSYIFSIILLHSGLSHHNSGQTAPPAEQTASCMSFFQHMYWTAAESMPTRLLGYEVSDKVYKGSHDIFESLFLLLKELHTFCFLLLSTKGLNRLKQQAGQKQMLSFGKNSYGS